MLKRRESKDKVSEGRKVDCAAERRDLVVTKIVQRGLKERSRFKEVVTERVFALRYNSSRRAPPWIHWLTFSASNRSHCSAIEIR